MFPSNWQNKRMSCTQSPGSWEGGCSNQKCGHPGYFGARFWLQLICHAWRREQPSCRISWISSLGCQSFRRGSEPFSFSEFPKVAIAATETTCLSKANLQMDIPGKGNLYTGGRHWTGLCVSTRPDLCFLDRGLHGSLKYHILGATFRGVPLGVRAKKKIRSPLIQRAKHNPGQDHVLTAHAPSICCKC